DTTACGDAYVGALAWALSAGQPLGRAVELANANGALAATREGAQPSLPTFQELWRFASF
ncbi:MAG: ribokinase, partial [Betaproteobacteria bacterium]|nr:ribokinase [Betaproteobacteria bacterium]